MGRKKTATRQRKQRRLNAASTRAIEEDNMRPALVVRCREMGWEPTVSNLARVRQPIFETRAGQLIVKANPGTQQGTLNTIAELFQALTHIRRVRARYLRAVAAPNPHPQNAAIAIVPDRFEVTADMADAPMPLEPEEEYARAKAAHENLQGWIADLPHAERVEVVAVAVNDKTCKDLRAYIRGLTAISDMLTGKRRKVA
jgi:hypothetical protein